MTYDTQWRATKEDTKNNQEQLRLLLEQLEKENRGIREEERGEFFSKIADGLLGLDFDREYILFLDDMTVLRIKNIGEFIRELAYQDTYINDVFLKKYGKNPEEKLEIKKIWAALKFIIFGMYPGAVNLAIKLSKERDNINYDEKEMASFGVKRKKKKPINSNGTED
jgi:hypothetical protein